MISFSINGDSVQAESGETILSVARKNSIDIPTLCYADGLAPEGGCRMCLVHSVGSKDPVAACHTEAKAGMAITTHNDGLWKLRRSILSFYLATSEVTGFNASAASGLFSELLHEHDLSDLASHPGAMEVNADDSHPYMRFQPDACITCRLCLNVCAQTQGQFVYGVENRGVNSRLIIGAEDQFLDSPCVSCGACVDVCPTGAIRDVDRWTGFGSPEEKHTESICGYCGVGCRIDITSKENIVQRVDGVREAKVNRGHLCIKGRYAHSYHHSPDRLTVPLLRDGEKFKEVEWDEALDYIANALQKMVEEHGPEKIGAFTSSRSTNESCYLLQKLFRAQLKSNNVDCCARVCHSSTALALQLVTGTGAASSCYDDLDITKSIVVAGANPTEAHPVAGALIKQAVIGGASLVVIDPRKIELADYADIHLQLVPGTNVALFNGLAKVMIEEELIDQSFINDRTEGFEELVSFLKGVSLSEVAEVTGVPGHLIKSAARIIGEAGPTLFVHGLGLSELMQGTASVMTLCNLGMLTGSIGKPGSGMLPLRGQNNVQGSSDMGSMPTHFTGYQSVGDHEVRERIKSVWGNLPPEEPGLPSTLMLKEAAEDNFKAVWLMGEDVIQSDPNETEVIKALQNMELIIVQDLFFSETCKYADVILPSCGSLEQEGTFTNGERRIQHVRPAVDAPGKCTPDWVPVLEVANRLGADWNYGNAGEIMDEIAVVAPQLFGGVNYDRLEGDGLQWPCPDLDHPGTSTVHQDGFLCGKGKLVTIEYEASPEHGVEGYPFLLVTGRLLEHYNVGTMTRRTRNHYLIDRDYLEIHPQDAAIYEMKAGDTAKISSMHGEISAPVKLSDRVAPGTLFLTFHYPETHTNRLTGPTLDPMSKCPQYKATAVKLSKIES